VSEAALECRESALTGCSAERAVVRKERNAIQVSRSHLCMMFVLLPQILRICRFMRLVRLIEQARVIAKLCRCRDDDLTRASGSAGRLGRDRGGFSRSNEIVGILKQLKDETSADLYALEKKGLDRKTKHQGLMNAETEELFVLTKAIGEKENWNRVRRRQSRWRRLLKPKKRPKRCQGRGGRHLGETSCKATEAAVEQKKQLDRRSKRSEPRKQRFNVVACTLAQRHEATSQKGVEKYHFCLSIPVISLWEDFRNESSLRKFMNVSDMQVPDEDDHHDELSRSKTIKANTKIVKERTWINRVAQRDVTNVKRSGKWLNMEFKTARAKVQEVRLEPRLRLTVASATREEHSH